MFLICKCINTFQLFIFILKALFISSIIETIIELTHEFILFKCGHAINQIFMCDVILGILQIFNSFNGHKVNLWLAILGSISIQCLLQKQISYGRFKSFLKCCVILSQGTQCFLSFHHFLLYLIFLSF